MNRSRKLTNSYMRRTHSLHAKGTNTILDLSFASDLISMGCLNHDKTESRNYKFSNSPRKKGRASLD
jgi:hypothetical protein